jgi:hypothetical protein
VDAIPRHRGRVTPCGGDQFVANHQQAKVIAGDVAFDQNFITKFGGGAVGRQQLLTRTDIDSDASP